MKKFFYGLTVALGMVSCSQKGVENSSCNSSIEVEGLGKVKPTFAYYDFSKDSIGCDIAGFSAREDFGRWSCSDTMWVAVKGEPLSEYTVKFKVNLFACEKHSKSVIDVYVNGEKLDQWTLFGETAKYISLRKDQIAQDGSALFQFVALDAMSPMECSNVPDDRRLSFYISDITLFGFKAE